MHSYCCYWLSLRRLVCGVIWGILFPEIGAGFSEVKVSWLELGYLEACSYNALCVLLRGWEPVSLPTLAQGLAISLIWSVWLSHTQHSQPNHFNPNILPNPTFVLFCFYLISSTKLYIQPLLSSLLSLLFLRQGSRYLRLASNLLVA